MTIDSRGYCWGEKWSQGQGGSRSAGPTSPRELPDNREWAVLEVGLDLICGLTRGGETFCWGPLGNLAARDTVPTRLLGDPGFAGITVGDMHACGLTAEGIAYCWGNDFRGQTGGGPSAPLEGSRRSATPVAGDLRFLALRAGPESTCGLVLNGDVYCWGGSSTSGEAITPLPVQEGFSFTSLDYGGNNGSRNQVCATDSLGNIYCFEYQAAELVPQPTPAAVILPGGGAARQVAVGGVGTPPGDLSNGYGIHACAVDTAGTVSCWGSNTYGQLGDGTTSSRPTPIQVPQLIGITGVASGGVHSCAVTEDGVAYCWGANHLNQLGMGRSSESAATPQQVVPPRP